MSERVHPKNTPEAQMHLNKELRHLQSLMEASKTVYCIVGGGAVHALFNRTLMPFRDNGTPVDIDGLMFGPDKDTVTVAQVALKFLKVQDKPLHEVGFESAHFSNDFVEQSPLSLSVLTGLRMSEDGKRAWIVYRNMEKEIPLETMEPIYRSLNGTEIPIFHAKTIKARYVLRGGGVIKPKDRLKLAELDAYIAKHPKEGPDDSLYEPYYEFVKEIKEVYPLMIGLFQLFWNADKLSGSRMSGAKSLYKLIPWFNR